MNVCIIGTGYVGLVTGACFAEKGNKVFCVDVNKGKIEGLKNGVIPIYEPGLEEIVKKNFSKGNLIFETELGNVLDKCDVVFSAVGTPSDVDGSADLKYVLSVAQEFGRLITKNTLFVTKSTVPVGTAKKIKNAVLSTLKARGVNIEFHVASNPEFLKEGSAVHDFMHPDRIVIGTEDSYSESLLTELYKPFIIDNIGKLISTDIPSAEMIKYAANSMLATRISFMNEIANLCEVVGANVDSVRRGIGTDTRIGSKFLYAGCGYGGSCFPKDVKALIKTGKDNGCKMELLSAVESVNENQKGVLFNKFLKHFSENDYRKITAAIFGLSFKPNTDDMREAPSLSLIRSLLKLGVNVRATDPIAIEASKKIFGNSMITYCKDCYEAAKGADVVFLVTEWGEFANVDWKKVKEECSPLLSVVIDGRNFYDKANIVQNGIEYECIGK